MDHSLDFFILVNLQTLTKVSLIITNIQRGFETEESIE
jgi:hypothetical protein